MTFLELKGITKTYGKNTEPCIKDLDFEMENGEIVVILGPSGCGKTTTLKIVAGLEKQDCGTVMIDGQLVDDMPPNKRPIAMVFQKSLLFKNMTVEQNINYAPRLTGTLRKDELHEEVLKMLKLVELEGYADKKATQLSGGQEQRVSLARALITKPKLLLLDEPFSALDAELRVSMRKSVREISKSIDQAMLFVTHDQQEAVSIADRIALMMDGKIIQYGPPEEFYSRPVSKRAAMFFGWKNFVPAVQNGIKISCKFGEFENNRFVPKNGDVLLAIRPESIIVSENGRFEGKVLKATYLGTRSEYVFDVNGTPLDVTISSRHMFVEEEVVKFEFDPKLMWVVEIDNEPDVKKNEEPTKKRFSLKSLKNVVKKDEPEPSEEEIKQEQ